MQNCNIYTTWELSSCYTIILWLFTRFKYLQIVRKLNSNSSSVPFLLVERETILPVVGEVTPIKKRIILESNRKCAKNIIISERRGDIHVHYDEHLCGIQTYYTRYLLFHCIFVHHFLIQVFF